MRLLLARSARQDLDSILAYIALDNPAAAERVYRKIVETAHKLTVFPKMGHPGRLPDTREFAVRSLPYLIVYRVAADTVTVLAIFHAARDLPRALSERRNEPPRQ